MNYDMPSQGYVDYPALPGEAAWRGPYDPPAGYDPEREADIIRAEITRATGKPYPGV